MTRMQTLKDMAAKQSTEALVGALLILDGTANKTDAEKMVEAATSDVLMERHGVEALLDELLFDENFEGTCTEALVIALAKVGA